LNPALSANIFSDKTMDDFFQSYSNTIQGIASVIVICTAVIGLPVFLVNKYRSYKRKVKDLRYKIKDFNINHLRALKENEIVTISEESDGLTITQIRELYNNKKVLDLIFDKYSGTHRTITEIVRMYGEVNRWKIFFRIVTLTITLTTIGAIVCLITRYLTYKNPRVARFNK